MVTMNRLRSIILAVAVNVVLASLAMAYVPRWPVLPLVESGAIKTWSTGETLTSADLNANFAHIHNLMVGGHGGRLLDADVNAGAAIASSKLAGYRLLPRAWVQVGDPTSGGAVCAAGTCTLAAQQNVTSVAWVSTGVYNVTLAYTPSNANFMAIANAVDSSGSDIYCMVRSLSAAAPHAVISCQDAAAVQTDSKPALVVYDND